MITYRQIGNELLAFEDDRGLCGPDYNAEAASWARNHALTNEKMIVIGLGSGFHIEALLQKDPSLRVVVIDTRAELVPAFRKRFAAIESRVEILIFGSTDEMLNHELMGWVVRDLPIVAAFTPAFGAQNELLNVFFATLTGRNRLGLSFFLKHLDIVEDDEAAGIEESGSLLTAKNIGLMVDTAKPGHPLMTAVKVLKELVN